MTVRRWRPGDVILMEMFTRHERLLNVMPQVVVEDGPKCLAILSQPGMTFFTRDEPGRTALPLAERVRIYLDPELRHDWYERTSRLERAVLTLYQPGAAHSVRLFWGAEWQFQCWYVNLEPPYRRTPTGIQVSDRILDIVVSPQFDWSWKDEDEFEALCRAGSFSPAEARAIRDEGEKLARRIEAREWPFNEPWPEWRPEPSWPVPRIADYWEPGGV